MSADSVSCLSPTLAAGLHTLVVRVSDLAGNQGEATFTFELLLGPGLHSVTFPAVSDTYLRQGQPNQSQGSESILRVRSSGHNRSLLLFDPAEIADVLAGAELDSATIRLFVELNARNWGSSGRTVDAHRLTVAWSELEATWHCAADADLSNQQPDCDPQWDGGTFAVAPSDSVLHDNQLSGWVEYDVTADLASFLSGGADQYGWLLRKTDEGASGRVDYAAREGVEEQAPQLLVAFTTVDQGDTEPPVVSALTPAAGALVAFSAPTVSASFADASGIAPASFSLAVDGVDRTAEAGVTAAGFSWAPGNALADGPHTVGLSVADTVGNAGTAAWGFTTDATPPVLAIVAPTEPTVLGDPTPAVMVTYQDGVSGVDLSTLSIRLDGILLAECAVAPTAATCEPPPLAEGFHTVEAEVSDLAGNATFASHGFDLVLDLEPPVVVFTSPADGAFSNLLEVEVTGTATDDRAVTSVEVNGVAATLSGEVFAALVPLEEGANGLLAIAADASGKQGVATAVIEVDRLSPELRLERPWDGQLVNQPTVRVAGRTLDNRGVAAVEIQGLPVALTDDRFDSFVLLAEGANEVIVRAIDLAGNVVETTASVTRITLPEVAIDSPADLSILSATTVTVTGTVSDPSVSVAVNEVAATVLGTTFTALGVSLVEGGNTLTATATDPLARVATDSVHLVRDLTPPRLAVYAPVDGEVVVEPTVVVRGLVNDIVAGTVNGSEAVVTVNGIAAEVVNRSFFLPALPLAPGDNPIEVVATDEVGNETRQLVTVVRQEPSGPRLVKLSGDQQSGPIRTALPLPLTVELRDALGQPAAGVPVVFALDGNDGELGGGRRRIAVATDAAGRAAATFTLGSRAGVGNQRVIAAAVGFGPAAVFTASAEPGPPALLVVDSGSLQEGVAGRRLPRPLIAAVVDEGSNRLAGVPVRFAVVKGGGTLGGESSLVVTSDSDGRAIAELTLDPEEGIANNVVRAELDGVPPGGTFATFVASGFAAGVPAATSVSGVVLDNSNLPVRGVTLRIRDTTLTAVADAEGQFRIAGAPVGTVDLLVDGSTAERPGSWPDLEFELTTIPGRDNDPGMPIYLLPIDWAQAVMVSETQGATLELAEVPGFALEIAPGSVTFPGGGKSGPVSVTVVHHDKVPMTPNFGQQPRLIVTIQPAGARFDPPARLTLPNVESLAPGSVTEMYSFDHDLGHFVSIGPATVSEDGLLVTSDPGVGVVKAGWHCGGNPAQGGSAHDCPQCQVCDGSTCVPGCVVPGALPTGPLSRAGSCGCSDGDACTTGDNCDAGGCKGERIFLSSVHAKVNGKQQLDTTVGILLFFSVDFESNCPDAEFLWDFGDDTTSTERSPQHRYTRVGRYRPKVTVTCGVCGEARGTDVVSVNVYTDDVTVIGWVDAAAIPLGELAATANALLVGALNLEPSCRLTLGSWVLGERALVSSEDDRRFANAFLVAHSGNHPPPAQIDPDASQSGQDYRVFNRLQAIFDTDGSTVSNVEYRHEAAQVGPTPDPCGPLVPESFRLGEEHLLFHGRKGDAGSDARVFQISEGRIGTAGQLVDRTLNACDTFSCTHVPVGPTTPWIWSVVRFGADGAAETMTQIFPTYSVFKQGILVETKPQGDDDAFIALDATDSEIGPTDIP